MVGANRHLVLQTVELVSVQALQSVPVSTADVDDCLIQEEAAPECSVLERKQRSLSAPTDDKSHFSLSRLYNATDWTEGLDSTFHDGNASEPEQRTAHYMLHCPFCDRSTSYAVQNLNFSYGEILVWCWKRLRRDVSTQPPAILTAGRLHCSAALPQDLCCTCLPADPTRHP